MPPIRSSTSRGIELVLSFGVTGKSDDTVDKTRITAGEAEGDIAEDINGFLRSARCRKARGYFGAAERLRDFGIVRERVRTFPANRSQVEMGNKRRVRNVKGAERIFFQRSSRGVFSITQTIHRFSRKTQWLFEIGALQESKGVFRSRRRSA
jgi:hypothetical protein